jgi:hypothetical protein
MFVNRRLAGYAKTAFPIFQTPFFQLATAAWTKCSIHKLIF